ncbi:MAG: cytochrome c oxidase assembly protein [Proteobacteria bacterium]|nr:cytochrome c oxidase assembly protein [Pseudomonadota bacterium]
MQNGNQNNLKQKKNVRLIIKLFLIAVVMFGFGFALVPIYNVMCKALNINGKISGATSYDASHQSIDKTREITVEFVATNNANLPWTFHPLKNKIHIHPGEMTRVAFYAKNNADQVMKVQAIPSITPGLAAKYLKKTECFCFTQQTLKPNESMDMPILFHIDPDLPKSINTITLSYTLFDVSNLHHLPERIPGKIQ